MGRLGAPLGGYTIEPPSGISLVRGAHEAFVRRSLPPKSGTISPPGLGRWCSPKGRRLLFRLPSPPKRRKVQPMPYRADLDLARHHLEEIEELIVRQNERIEWLRRNG